MTAIRTVNLIWEKRIRGTYPVAPHALDNDGTLTLAVPRPLEVRTYDLARLRPDGGVEHCGNFSVETLLKLEVTHRSDNFLGMTADDVYLFHAGQKRRFLGDKRILFVDASLSANGEHVVAGFSDLAGSSFALAPGGVDGQIRWTCDLDAPLARVVISAQGDYIAAGLEDGTLLLIDQQMRERYRFVQPEPVRALACSYDGLIMACGTDAGSVGLVDAGGTRLWETRLQGSVVAVALPADASCCVALSVRPDAPDVTHLICLTEQGQVSWEMPVEKRLFGLALSPDGRYMATGARDGTTTVYELIPGAAVVAVPAAGRGPAQETLDRYAHLQGADPREAYHLLLEVLHTCPVDVALAREFARRHQEWVQEQLESARAALQTQDISTALSVLERALEGAPQEPQLTALLAQARTARAQQLLAGARQQRASGDTEGADRMLREALEIDPFAMEARQELADLRAQICALADAEAERLLAEGHLDAAVATMEQAQTLAPSAERAERLARAQIAMEFATGMEHYHARRYPEAVFQFKKVLARDPGHAEAQRYLNFARSFLQDTSVDVLSDRFRRIE
ncbi:MAG: hypothetical protein RMJ43_05175 [Chloroherpetonaceae bacterium]|nr:hypothetical protein [Chthonomonadaceae bacterium]MDW8207208.1 hypothetical protein [Chloroherpetonaceae bacterium]